MSEEKQPIEQPAPDSGGQNPLWPGEGLKNPGTVIIDPEHDEKTIIPIIQ